MEEDSDISLQQIQYDWQPSPNHSVSIEQSPPNRQNSFILQNQLNDLDKAKERFKLFLEEIGELKYTPIRQDVNSYYGTQKNTQKTVENYMRSQCLMRKLQIRIEKMVKTKRIKRNWGEQDLKILIWIISKYSDLKKYEGLQKDLTYQDWTFISSLIPGVNAEACMFKWLSIKKITLASHSWTKNESAILANIVKQKIEKKLIQGEIKDWKKISQELFKLNEDQNKVYRNAKQCRQHWTCYLSPRLKKGPWQLYQDINLLKFIKDNKGQKKWSQIAKNFQGRTENALKNRYTLIIQKQKKMNKNKGKNEIQLINQYLQKNYVDQFTVKLKTEEDVHDSDHSQIKVQQTELSPLSLKPKKEEQSPQTTDDVITPIRVQKFNFNDFETMNINFFKHIQPGVIESNGTFKKIPNNTNIKELGIQTVQKQPSDEGKMKKKGGPFTIIPVFKKFIYFRTQ